MGCRLAAAILFAAIGTGPALAESAAPDKVTLEFLCEYNGMQGRMVVEVETFPEAGITRGPGPYPEITGVVFTGQKIRTEGRVTVGPHSYVFEGENEFADFSSTTSFDRFLGQFIPEPGGVVLVVDPFGQQDRTSRHWCALISG